jgi:hypothetical protein
LFVAQEIHQFRPGHRHHGFELLAGSLEVPRDVRIRYRDILNVVAIHFLEKLRERKGLRAPRRRVLDHVIQQNSRRQDQNPE